MSRLLYILLFVPQMVMTQDALNPETLDTVDWDLLLEDVVVTATYAPTSAKEAIHDVRVLDRVDIDRLQARNLKQLLIADASLRIQEDRVLGSETSLLGIGGQNVKIMIDGVPVIGRLDGNIDLGQLHLNDVEQVEIVEGPLSVNYGTDALAGVINIITKKSQLNNHQLQLDAAYEDRGEQTISAFYGFRPNEKWFIKAQAGYDEFKGFDVDSTRSSLWKPKEQIYGGGIIRFMPNNNHDFKYTYNFLDEEVVNLGDIRRPQFKPYAFDESFRTIRHDHVLHYDGDYGKGWYIRAFAARNTFNRTIDSWRKDIEQDEELSIPSEQDTNFIESWNMRATLSYQPANGKIQFQTGIDSRYDRNAGDRIVSPGDSTNSSYIFDQAFFGSIRYAPNDHLTLETGLRYAINNRFETPLVPSFNVRYQLNEHWTFRASYGKGFRSPDIKELFFNFIDVNHYILGNADLKPETSNNGQLGITYYRNFRDQEVTFGLKGFYNDIRDKIELFEYVETPEGLRPAVDTITNEYTYFNLNQFRTAGLSSRFGYDAHRWRVRLAYTLTGRYNPELDNIDRDNRYAFNSEISLNGQYSIPVIDVQCNALIRYYDRLITFFPGVDSQGNEFLGERIQDGYTNVDLYLSKTVWSERVNITAGTRNLLDVTFTRTTGSADGAHASTSTQQAISTGRRFFVAMTMNLAWD